MLLPTLRVLTWNLGRLHLGERWNRFFGLDSRAADGDLPHVARVIDRSQAEVVAVQELAREEQIGQLSSLLGEEWQAATPKRESGDRRVGLLVRRILSPVFEAIDLVCGRSAQAVSLGSDGKWAIASLHFDAYDARARQAQANEVLAWTDSRAEPAVILAGDLNLDARYPARKTEDAATYDALSHALLDVGRAAGATALLGRRVDYVLARGVAGRAEVLHGLRVPLGDHDPVLAHLLRVGPFPTGER